MIYRYNNYKAYVNDVVKSEGVKGAWSRMAEFLGIQPVVVSQVFKGERDLNEEQSFMVASYLQLDEMEEEYFLLLVRENKTSHSKYKIYLKKQMSKLKKEFLKPSSFVEESDELPAEIYALYYSSWKYSVVRLLCFISGDSYEIARGASVLNISPLELKKILKQLVLWGLLDVVKDKYYPTKQRLHLDDRKDILATHLTNWRLQSIKKIQQGYDEYDPIHYSSTFTLDEGSSMVLREDLNKLIRKASRVIKKSESKHIYNLNLDLLRLL